MARKVRFDIVRDHSVDEDLTVEDGWKVMRVEWVSSRRVTVVLMRDPRPQG